jgi:hypothetical protein
VQPPLCSRALGKPLDFTEASSLPDKQTLIVNELYENRMMKPVENVLRRERMTEGVNLRYFVTT